MFLLGATTRAVSMGIEAELAVPNQVYRGCSIFVGHVWSNVTDVTLDRPKLGHFE